MSEIVVGVDGSESSRAALRWAARVAEATGSTLRAVSAWQYPARAGTPAGPTELPPPAKLDRQTRVNLRTVVNEELGDKDHEVKVEAGRGPASEVLLTASRSNASMLVLGDRGLGGFDGLLLGSVTQQCVEHSSRPVVVIRGDSTSIDGPFVVGLDGSEGATRALEWTIELAAVTGSEIVAVHSPSSRATRDDLTEAGKALERWCAPIRERDIAYSERIEAGEARHALENATKETDAALLVVGTRGHGPVKGLLVGSVAGYAVRYLDRPVAVIPGPELN